MVKIDKIYKEMLKILGSFFVILFTKGFEISSSFDYNIGATILKR